MTLKKMILVQVCNICDKPHYGRSNVKDRCVCDTSGNFRMEKIEEEVTN
jgi:hypothetical protein